MKYYKTLDGYVAIDESTPINANGHRIPTSILAYGRGPTRPNEAGSVAARAFDVASLNRDGTQVEANEVPNEWRAALGLVKVDPVCPMPAGKTPEVDYGPEFPPLSGQIVFFVGVLFGMALQYILKFFH